MNNVFALARVAQHHKAAVMVSFGTMLCLTASACAQTFPIKPLRIVTAEIGSSNDIAARHMAQGLTANLGQQVLVDNRGVLAIDLAARAQPDGYTLLVYGTPLWLTPFMRKVSYDVIRDFAPITLAVSSPSVFVVPPSLPVTSVKDLIAMTKARPGELNYGSGSTGSGAHLAAELFKALAGVDIVRIPYKGAGLAINDLLSGQLQLVIPSVVAAMSHVKSGRLKALAVGSAEPSVLMPGLPTAAASGVPGYTSTTIIAAFAPAKTPAELVSRLNQEVKAVLIKEDIKNRFLSQGAEVVASSPEDLTAKIKAEMSRLGKVIADAGIREE